MSQMTAEEAKKALLFLRRSKGTGHAVAASTLTQHLLTSWGIFPWDDEQKFLKMRHDLIAALTVVAGESWAPELTKECERLDEIYRYDLED
jgi:hypothetical protein